MAGWSQKKKLSNRITAIAQASPAAHSKLAVGDILFSINGHPINDILDYRFYQAEEKLNLVFERRGKLRKTKIKKEQYDDLGLEFESGLMSDQCACQNNCIFCFIDQLPPGLRAPLYFKDDDARLGFLFGNYITLTNLTDHDVQRIISMRLSPVNISVHTMNPALRCRMMGNKHAGETLKYLAQFAAAGLDLNIQLVLCPGINDGDELRFSLEELLKLPTVKSIAAVPVGITKHRKNLYPLKPFTKEQAQSVIDIFDEFRPSSCELCASDEFFLLAKAPIPSIEYYGSFCQLENGVGLWASFKDDMLAVLEHNYELCIMNYTLHFTIVTGVAAYPLMQFFVDEIKKTWHNININVLKINNTFFGEHITVAGLLTGQDVIEQLKPPPLPVGHLPQGGDPDDNYKPSAIAKGSPLGELARQSATEGVCILLPAVMFNHDGLTLDGLTAQDISQALNCPVKVVENDAQALIDFLHPHRPSGTSPKGEMGSPIR